MADKIVGEYDIKVDKALKQLDKLEKKVEDLGEEGEKSAKKTREEYNKSVLINFYFSSQSNCLNLSLKNMIDSMSR